MVAQLFNTAELSILPS